jgi:polyisoprenoid-binding protein YceI
MSFKKSLLVIFSASLVPGLLWAASFTVDGAHSNIGFSVKHLGVSKVRGQFSTVSGKINWDEKKVAMSSFEGEIDVNSINTNNEKRDGHLKSPDFFETEKYPTMLFKSTRVVRENDQFVVYGSLMMHGVTKDVKFPVAVLGPVKGPMGETRIGFEGGFTVDRRDFGLTWSKSVSAGELLVGNDVEVNFSVEAVEDEKPSKKGKRK